MNAGRRPVWLGVSLTLLLLLLALGAWLGAGNRPVSMPATAPVVAQGAYEDFHAVPDPAPASPAAPSTATEESGVPEPAAPRPSPPPAAPPASRAGGIALVIDDVGYDLPALRRLLALDAPMAIAVLPDAPHARQAAEMAHRAGQVVMLHLPMEPANPKYRARMDAGFLKESMDRAQIRALIERALAQVPWVAGVNNHMGSLLTASSPHMHWVMAAMRERGLFFIDSRTGRGSVAAREAALQGVRWASRRIFLDHRQDEDAMRKAWVAARHCAAAGHACVVIAHPHPATVAFLEHALRGEARALLRPVTDALHPAALAQGAGIGARQ